MLYLFLCSIILTVMTDPNLLPVNLLSYQVESLSPEDTDGIIRVAREYRRGGENSYPDLKKASQLYNKVITHGEGPSQRDAMFELASINTQSLSENFALLSK
jgi:hypothetical protein